MSGEQYAILAYVVGLGLVGAYSARLWLIHRALARRARAAAAHGAPEAAAPPAPGVGGLRVERPINVARPEVTARVGGAKQGAARR